MFLEFSLVLVFALLVAMFFKRLRVPLIVSYVFAGLIFGNAARFIISDESFLRSAANMGVILLLFTIGVEFPTRSLKERFPPHLVYLTITQLVLSSLVLGLFFFVFRLSPGSSMLLSILFSFSSTALVMKILSVHGELKTQAGESAISILLLQDLVVMPVSLFLPLFLKFSGLDFKFIADSVLIFLRAGALFLLIYLLAKKLLPLILRKVAESLEPDLLILSIVAIAFLFAATTQKIGFSLASGAFLSGIIVASTSQKHAIFSEVRPLRDLFSIIFFISLGFLIDFKFLFANLFLIIILAVSVVLVKLVVSYFCCLTFKIHKKNALFVAVYLSQISEFSFILSSDYFNNQLIGESDYKLIVAVSLLTIIFSSFLVKFAKRARKLRFFQFPPPDKFALADPIPLANHVVLCGFGRVGKQILRQLTINKIPAVVIDYNVREITGLQEKGYNAIYGDPVAIEILNYAGVAKARAIALAIPDRFSNEIIIQNALRLNPQIKIFARVHFEEDKKFLYAVGSSYVMYPEFEGALVMSKRILKAFYIDDALIAKSISMAKQDEKII